MASITEGASMIGFDALEIDILLPNPNIKKWFEGRPQNRFDDDMVFDAFGQTVDQLGGRKKLSESTVNEKNKLTFCLSAMGDIMTSEREAGIYTFLENLKGPALIELLKNENTRKQINNSNTPSQLIDKLVTFQVIQFFFDYIDDKQEKKSKTDRDPLDTFSLN